MTPDGRLTKLSDVELEHYRKVLRLEQAAVLAELAHRARLDRAYSEASVGLPQHGEADARKRHRDKHPW